MRLHFSTTQIGNNFLLQEDEFRHSIKVLRQKVGDTIMIFDGNGIIYTCEICEMSKKHLVATIITEEKMSPIPYHLAIAMAPTKSPSRFEWFIEKAVEIGVSAIYPMTTARSEKASIKIDRLERIVISAMKQSRNIYQPRIYPLKTFAEIIENVQKQNKFIAYVENDDNMLSKQSLDNDIIILIGPEGGFSSDEVSVAKTNNYLPVSLGNSRLRTETAGVAACQIIKTWNEINL